MKNTRILVVEDEAAIRETIASFLELEDYHVTQAINGKDAMEKSRAIEYDLYLVDLMMPILSGEQFIKQLKTRIPDALVIVLTAVINPEKIVKIMRMGVYNYVVKPFDNMALMDTLQKAIEYRELILLAREKEMSANREKQSEILWDNYKTGKLNKENIQVSVNLINNLQSTISQGSGFGAAMTLTDMINMTKEPIEIDGQQKYTIDKEILDLLVNNNTLCRQQISSITNALTIFSDKSIELKENSSGEIIQCVEDIVEEFQPLAEEKKALKFIVERPKTTYKIQSNLEYLKIAFEELLVNAMKFTTREAHISVITGFKDGFFSISVINPVDEKVGSISQEQESLILKPFLRLLPPVELFYDIEKYAMGLGLSIVHQIVLMHSGELSVRNIVQHLGDKPQKSVIADVTLPIQVIN